MKKIASIIISFALGLSLIPAQVFAACPEGCVPTAILGESGCSCDDGKGSGITDILNLVVNIMTIGIGVLGVLGITIVGIQYLTAGGNEEQTRKAKRRMFEIVIGLVAYVLVYAVLSWLIPDFRPLGS